MSKFEKVALVTGGGSGIGRAVSKRLAQDGMAVCVADIIADKAQAVAAEIKEAGGEAIAIQVDVTSPESQDKMFAAVLEAYGRLDCVASNAGILRNDPFTMISYETWDRLMSINLDGFVLCAQKAAEIMIKQGWGGKIGFTLSQGGFAENDNATVSYLVSKWAGRGWLPTVSMSMALAPATFPHPCWIRSSPTLLRLPVRRRRRSLPVWRPWPLWAGFSLPRRWLRSIPICFPIRPKT